MSYAESPTQTVKKFTLSPAWKNGNRKEITNDLLTANSESNLFWDHYIYEERDRQLYCPVRERFVAGTGGNEVEEGVITQLNEWFSSHDSGIAVSISPRDPNGLYPDDKIAIHRIAYKWDGKKVLLSASHPFRTRFRNPEDIRRFIFVEEDKEESVFEIINWLTRVSEKKVETDAKNFGERQKSAEFYTDQYLSGASIDKITYEMTQTGFIGVNPMICTTTQVSTTPFGKFFTSESKGWSYHTGNCTHCLRKGVDVGPCGWCKTCEAEDDAKRT